MSARIFTAEEELPFAGHPVIGAAAALHERFTAGEPARSWVFVIAGREITVRSRRTAVYYEAEMDQGSPTLDPPLGQQDAAWFARALKFVYLFEPDKREGRSWDNTGAVEDVATGSAAGPAAAFLAAHGLAAQDETIGVGATSSASAWAVGFLRAPPEARLSSCIGTAARGRGWPAPTPVAPATNCGLWPPPPPATHGWSAASATTRRRSPSTAADRACDLRRRSGRAGRSARGRRHGPRQPPRKANSQDPVRTARRLWALVRWRSWPL